MADNRPGNDAAQPLVDRRFSLEAAYWDEVYRGRDLFCIIHQQRVSIALDWVDRLGLSPGSRVLEVGSGTGVAAVALAQRGLCVEAVDRVTTMLDLTRRHAVESGLARAIRTTQTSADALGFADGTFSLTMALGVLPWLGSPRRAMREMARVLAPGGYLIANVDNRARLDVRLDPWRARAHRRRISQDRASTGLHSRLEMDIMTTAAGLENVAGRTFGFGPFTLMDHGLLPEPLNLRLNGAFQRMADAGAERMRELGNQYIVLARKPGPDEVVGR